MTPETVPAARRRSRWARALPVADLRAASATVRLLVLTQLAFNVGFFMVLPYLSVHLTGDLGLGAATVGVILGVRTFSQQGLFFLGGTLADRVGIRPVVLTGCTIRVVGFVGLAFAESLVAVLVATVLVGVAAALFSPAVESAVAVEGSVSEQAGGQSRLDAFALFTVCGQIGSFTGPLIGSLLLLVDFRIACLCAAVVFVAVTVTHAVMLPARRPAESTTSWFEDWRIVARNRLFLVFALATSVQLVAYNQLYLLLPLRVDQVWGSQAPLGWLFAASSLLVVAAQMPLTRAARRRPLRAILPAGFVVMAAAFGVAGVAAILGATGWAGLIGPALFVVLLTLGQMIAMPFARDLVPVLAGDRTLGAYYGFLASAGGIGVLVGSAGLGAVVDAVPDTALGHAAPWLLGAALPLAAAAILRSVAVRVDPVQP
ncbi:Major Facilitator Superfamily protein [Rhodococcoides kroppenstedtii]|uniref:Major Facilitator Superfamily protein n=1 Tax=Rhodococcoides kroppenstedtii TaxID=293050 RepID=A0A1I0U7Q9_9NOCA|nr:MFS transporter [Rhodococcus kroppenstedtii]SFA59913.1 Major Facilitator Superfamily protein [Rhodococcus kroppenstedtii]